MVSSNEEGGRRGVLGGTMSAEHKKKETTAAGWDALPEAGVESAAVGSGGGKERLSLLRSLLSSIYLDSEPAASLWSDPRSHRSRALQWMALDDPLRVPLPPPSNYDARKVIQRYTLAALYYATDGPNSWTQTLGFLTGVDECEWNSVDSDTEYFSGAGACGSDGLVTALALWDNGLSGTIPEELGELKMLRTLSLYKSNLMGMVPKRLSELAELSEFSLLLSTAVVARLRESGGMSSVPAPRSPPLYMLCANTPPPSFFSFLSLPHSLPSDHTSSPLSTVNIFRHGLSQPQ